MKMKLIKGNQYLLSGKTIAGGDWTDVFTYEGIWQGFTCPLCRQVRERGFAFINGEVGNPNFSMVFGSECLKKIKIVSIHAPA